MKRRAVGKVLGAGMLALTVFVSPLASTYAWATEVDGVEDTGAEEFTGEGGSVKGLNPLQDEEIPAVEEQGTEGEEDYVPAQAAVPAYEDVEIPVWGYTEDATVYSVDVEWGAMTFQWENSSWNPETHMKKDGAGWRVYDSEAEKAVTDTKETAINEIKVTNHSNAEVYATLTYAAESDYSGTTGKFGFNYGLKEDLANSAELAKKFAAATDSVPAYLSLESADNGEDGNAGMPTVGKAYFMPQGLDTDTLGDDGITKWTKIGTITVGIRTEQPAAVTDAEETP